MATILIVDDAAFMRMMIKDILSKNGYEVVGEAENGAKAIEKYKELNPDLVIMDITMPEVDGIQAVKEIKKVNSNSKIIMCVITSYSIHYTKLYDGTVQFVLIW